MRIAVVFAIGLSLVLSACGGGKKEVGEQEKAKGQAVDEKGRKVAERSVHATNQNSDVGLDR